MSWLEDQDIFDIEDMISDEYHKKEIENRFNGYIHINVYRQKIDIRTIDKRYATNLYKWYQNKSFFEDWMLDTPFMQCLADKMNTKQSFDSNNRVVSQTNNNYEEEGMDNMDKIAKVQFFNDKGEVNTYSEYHYYTLVEDLELGDLVVVETRNGYKVVQFTGYISTSPHAKAYIIQKVDVDKVEKQKEKKKEIHELKRQMKQRAKELEERRELEALAKDDETMKDLLKKLDELNK